MWKRTALHAIVIRTCLNVSKRGSMPLHCCSGCVWQTGISVTFLICCVSIYYYSRLICCILISVTFLTLQISPAPIRVGEGEPPPSWDPVPTPKGTKLLVSLLLILWIVYTHIINWLWTSMNYICLSLLVMLCVKNVHLHVLIID
jgi:hypothetical protein